MTWTVIVPSRNDAAIVDFVGSLLAAHPGMSPDQCVIVDDGLSDYTREALSDVRMVAGANPFVFARAINMGVAAADREDDIVIVGDDVRFLTAGMLDSLSVRTHGAAVVSPEIIGHCGQAAQKTNSTETEAPWLAFICAYIPREVWDAVGELDERFVGYGFDDIDWCLRAAGFGEMRIEHDQRVAHIDCSTFRGTPGWVDRYVENRAIFTDKWGDIAA